MLSIRVALLAVVLLVCAAASPLAAGAPVAPDVVEMEQRGPEPMAAAADTTTITTSIIMAESQNETPRKLDETLPGGYYLNDQGEPHDAEGKPIKEVSEEKLEAVQTEAAATAGSGTTETTGGPSRTSLGETQFASAAAKTAAEEAGLVEADFVGQEPSSENGFTKADVTAIADVKA